MNKKKFVGHHIKNNIYILKCYIKRYVVLVSVSISATVPYYG